MRLFRCRARLESYRCHRVWGHEHWPFFRNFGPAWHRTKPRTVRRGDTVIEHSPISWVLPEQP